MRNLFDQYSQPENRLTHSLATVLDQDRKMLKSFLSTFGPKNYPSVRKLQVIEQSLPGRPETSEDEASKRGLPDALIFDNEGWALVIESKIGSGLTKNQLRRHRKTIERCGFNRILGLAITVQEPTFELDGWSQISWKDVYSWCRQYKQRSQWADFLVDYFDIAESRMANDKYLKEGTITEFSGISFDPYTYLEAKRVLRLLTQKIRDNDRFIRDMGLDSRSGRSSITDQRRVWDFICFVPPDGRAMAFQKYPHCTVALGPDDAEAMVTVPHATSRKLRNRLVGDSFDAFAESVQKTSDALVDSLQGLRAYRPTVRAMQRRYQTQRSIPMMDGDIEFDMRTIFGEPNPSYGPPIKQQSEWAHMVFDLLRNKRSNIQFQVGVQYYYPKFDELAHKNADQHFIAAFRALRPFISPIVDESIQ